MRKFVKKHIRRIKRIKDCQYCKTSREPDYKETDDLRKYLTERGKIIPRLLSGVCQKHQRKVNRAIKQARYMALLSFMVRPS